jgi:hypothetical protein
MQPLRSVVAVAAVFGTAGTLAASVTFPGPINHTTDPAGRFEIRWSESNDGSPHRLLFAAVGSASVVSFLTFERSATVLWAPKGAGFAVTDHKGSDNSQVLVFTVPPAQPIDMLPALPSAARSLVENNHHAYIEAVAWNRQGLSLRAHGYGDRSPNGFAILVRCSERSNVWHCR